MIGEGAENAGHHQGISQKTSIQNEHTSSKITAEILYDWSGVVIGCGDGRGGSFRAGVQIIQKKRDFANIFFVDRKTVNIMFRFRYRFGFLVKDVTSATKNRILK